MRWPCFELDKGPAKAGHYLTYESHYDGSLCGLRGLCVHRALVTNQVSLSA